MNSEIVLTQRELLSLSSEVRNQVRESVSSKRIQKDAVATNALDVHGELDDELFASTPARADAQAAHMPAAFAQAVASSPDTPAEPRIYEPAIIADPYEAYLTVNPELAANLRVGAQTASLRSILPVVAHLKKVEAIVDSAAQIIAMSEQVCHALALDYDPAIRLPMESANGNLDWSLGMAHNVPFTFGEITLYLQVHIIREPAYDILLGRPFDVLTDSVVRTKDEQTTVTIKDPNSDRVATVATIPRGTARFYTNDPASQGFRDSRI
jgi:hypothetical protein